MKRLELDEAVKAYLADLVQNDLVVTFADEAEAVLKNRRAAQAIGQGHARLSREFGGRYPGTNFLPAGCGGRVRAALEK